MKSLFLIRHAKSSWDNTQLTDSERPLNTRGIASIPLMADFLLKRGERIEHFYSSSAVRTSSTAKGIVGKMGYNEQLISHHPELYLASSREMLRITCGLPDTLKSAALVGHNPGITEYCEYLTDQHIGNLSTCGIARIDFETESWKEVSGGTGKLVFMQVPKELG
ncbi:MAG: histidine phosphatase family protein [Bacteroidota bacterium]